MYKATVIEIFIVSPSDIIQEKNCFREIIEEWNIINSKLPQLEKQY
jgi:choline kinase